MLVNMVSSSLINWISVNVIKKGRKEGRKGRSKEGRDKGRQGRRQGGRKEGREE